ncbi:MAG: ribosomal protein S18-alanine N-acetyltransferase [Fimbriimonadaceae bacterium]|nr:ribosomal protein S18-alanine N-acetyltransferase [Fimbriimonadaceae bacterium]
MSTLRFATLEEAHIPAILDIEKLVNTAPWSERSFRNELDHPHGIFLVALLDGNIVGYGGFWMVIDEAHITTVAVSKSHQREGLGTKLVIDLLRRAKERGMTCSTLEVRAGNESAIKLYEKMGYIVAARRKAYYPDNKEDALVMWLHHLQDWEAPKA